MVSPKTLRLCLVSKLPCSQAETFVQQLATELPFDTRVLHGQPPHTDNRSGFLYDRSLIQRAWWKLRKQWSHNDETHWQHETMARYFRTGGFHVVLAEYGPVGVQVMGACQRARVPLIVHFHGSDAFQRSVRAAHRDSYLKLFELSRGIVAVSRDMIDELVALGACREKIVWIPCGVDTSYFSGGVPEVSAPHLLFVGRFVEKKAPHLTLLAFARATAACPDAHLTMVGDGPLRGACEHLARFLEIESQVTFTGTRNHAYVCGMMRRARALVQHSVRASDGDSEGTPVAVTEAQSCGLPVVATRHMGIKDVVVEGETGLLLEEFDVDGMAEAMLQLLRDPELAGRLGRAGRKRIFERFSSEKSLADLSALITRLAREPR